MAEPPSLQRHVAPLEESLRSALGGFRVSSVSLFCMCSSVSIQFTSCCKGGVTLSANERPFSRMFQHVRLKRQTSCVGEIALFASKRLLVAVNQHVRFQVAFPFARVATLVATVQRLLSIIQCLLRLFCNIDCLHFNY